MAKFFRFPFGVSGDRTVVPDTADPGGSVSYSQGFGPDYELELGVDPSAKPVPRPETNQLYYDATDNIRQYQLNGVPEWYPPSENGGVAISYPLNSVTRHNDLVYRSIVATNTVEPGTDATKWVVDGVAGQATTAVAGLTRYATDPETVARAATDRAVTPSNLAALWALLQNNPVLPEVLGSTGLFTLTNPASNVRIAAGAQWVHRGVNTYTSVQTDLATAASKTYHLRWDPTNGFALYDLSNGAYNPSAVPETDPVFDTTFDNMLIARVVTNAGNVSTITALVNRARLRAEGRTTGVTAIISTGSGNDGVRASGTIALNWSRTPTMHISGTAGMSLAGSPTIPAMSGWANLLAVTSRSRYGVDANITTDYAATVDPASTLLGQVDFTAVA